MQKFRNMFITLFLVGFSISAHAKLTAKTLLVVDENRLPVADVRVLVGDEPDNPFKGNELVSDQDGIIDIPKSWTSKLSVTLELPGYVRTTYLDVEPFAQELMISTADGKNSFEVSGETKEYGRLRKDGYINFSLVIPALTQRNMLSFDVSSVISPTIDKLTVAGRTIEIPSNISIPKQKESYILPLTFNKPKYRMQVRKPGFYKFFATHGKFPLRDVINDLRNGKTIFEVINFFDFIGGGQADLQVDQNLAKRDIPVDQMKFDQNLSVVAPSFGTDLEMLSMALVNQGGFFFPSDLKRVKAKQSTFLKYPSSQSENFVLSVLMDKNTAQFGGTKGKPIPTPYFEEQYIPEIINISNLLRFREFTLEALPFGAGTPTQVNNYLSIALGKAGQEDAVNYLPFVDVPKITSDTIILNAPGAVPGISPQATLIVLSELEYIPAGNIQIEKRTRIWEVLASGWSNNVNLPNIKSQIEAGKKYRWEVLFLGRDIRNFIPAGSSLLDGVTHVSRNSFDF